jgi:PAS domain S-box-containing protein
MGLMAKFEPDVHHDLRMRALGTMAPVAQLETTIEGHVSWANERWWEFAGVQSNDAMGRTWFDAIHPDERTRVIEVWQKAASELAIVTIECRLFVPRQCNRWIEVQGAPLSDPSSGTTTYVLTATDVTQKRSLNDLTRTTKDLETWAEQSAAALAQQSKELGIFAALVASCAEAIAIVNPNETVHYVNAAFAKLFDVATGISWPELLLALGVDENAARALYAANLADEAWQSMVTLERPQLGTLHAELSSFSIVDVTSRKIGLAIVVRDLSAYKEVEVERARLHAEIVAAQAAAIRELSTPLLPIGPGILAMPLVGTIDAARGRRILDTLLLGIHEHYASVAILDVTGVRQINADVADMLLRSARAAELLGTNVLLTGVSPFVAKTIIQLGADLSRVKTLATLEQGIRAAFAHTRSHKERNRRTIHPLSTT